MMSTRANPILERAEKMRQEKPVAHTVKLRPVDSEQKYYRKESAAESIGVIEKDLERYILSKGQFSLIEFLECILAQTGPAHIVVSTWTAAGRDISDVHDFVTDGRILSCRFLVDFTFQRRSPQFCGQMRQLFGQDSIRVTRNHAKLAIITNEKWNICILTSANLNMNPRMEYFLIRESKELTEFNLAWIDNLFKSKSSSDHGKAAQCHKQDFIHE